MKNRVVGNAMQWFVLFCLGRVTVKNIEIEIIRSGSRQDIKKELDKVVKKFRSKGLEVVGQWFKGLGYSLRILMYRPISRFANSW